MAKVPTEVPRASDVAGYGPPCTTHRQLNDEELEKAGVPRDMVRLSIGIEHSDDIIADLAQALEASRG